MGNERLTLKWGSIKGWSNLDEAGPAFAALKRWAEEGYTLSAAMQVNTPTQKQAICDCIDVLDGIVDNDWTGKTMTKDEAKTYVMEYRR